MELYGLDIKLKNKSKVILEDYIKEQREQDRIRLEELRMHSKNILEKNGIFEDRKNSKMYQNLDEELKTLENNINIYNNDNLTNLARKRIENGIDNISYKIECLQDNSTFTISRENIAFDRKSSESQINAMAKNYVRRYKANVIGTLIDNGYSLSTVDNIEEGFSSGEYPKYIDIFTEKVAQDGLNNLNKLNSDITNEYEHLVDEAEERYICKKNGVQYDELKDKKEELKAKIEKFKSLKQELDDLRTKENI